MMFKHNCHCEVLYASVHIASVAVYKKRGMCTHKQMVLTEFCWNQQPVDTYPCTHLTIIAEATKGKTAEMQDPGKGQCSILLCFALQQQQLNSVNTQLILTKIRHSHCPCSLTYTMNCLHLGRGLTDVASAGTTCAWCMDSKTFVKIQHFTFDGSDCNINCEHSGCCRGTGLCCCCCCGGVVQNALS